MMPGYHPRVGLGVIDFYEVGGRPPAPASHHKEQLVRHTRTRHPVGRVCGTLVVPVQVTQQSQGFHNDGLGGVALFHIFVRFYLKVRIMGGCEGSKTT